jgi:hypothetical protein
MAFIPMLPPGSKGGEIKPALSKKPVMSAKPPVGKKSTMPKTETKPAKPGYVPPGLTANGVESDTSDSSSSESSTDKDSSDSKSGEKKKKRNRRGSKKPKQPTEDMNRRQDSGAGASRSPYERSSGTREETGSGLFNKPYEFRGFGKSGGGGKSDFTIKIQNTLHLNEFEKSSLSGSKLQPQLLFNLGKFNAALGNGLGFVGEQVAVIYYRWTKEIFAKIKSSATSIVTLSNFRLYLQNMAFALEIYYSVDAILAYTGVSSKDMKDNNKCMLIYQQYFNTFAILNAHKELGQAIQGYWFPPRLSELIRHTYQTFKIGTNERSALFRFVPNNCFLFSTNTPFDETLVVTAMQTAVTGLQNENLTKLSSLFADVSPEGRIVGLPPSNSQAEFNHEMLEIMVNQPLIYWNDRIPTPALECFPNSSDSEIPYYFNGKSSEHNGFAFTMQNIKTKSCVDMIGLFTTREWTSTFNTEKCNKFTCFTVVVSGVETINMWSRTDTPTVSGVPDCHLIRPMRIGDVNSYDLYSRPSFGMNRGYYDNVTAPEVSLGETMSYLFGVKL